MRWVWWLLAGLVGAGLARLSTPWIMETFQVEHPGVIALPAILGLVVLSQLVKAVIAGVRAYRKPR